jgi:methyl-accepting chemotaxis protein
MTATTEAMSASADRTGNAAQSAASASAQALANAQTVASAAEQLSSSIREIGAQVAQPQRWSAAPSTPAARRVRRSRR